MGGMRVHIGCDHAGLELKSHLINRLTELGYERLPSGRIRFIRRT